MGAVELVDEELGEGMRSKELDSLDPVSDLKDKVLAVEFDLWMIEGAVREYARRNMLYVLLSNGRSRTSKNEEVTRGYQCSDAEAVELQI